MRGQFNAALGALHADHGVVVDCVGYAKHELACEVRWDPGGCGIRVRHLAEDIESVRLVGIDLVEKHPKLAGFSECGSWVGFQERFAASGVVINEARGVGLQEALKVIEKVAEVGADGRSKSPRRLGRVVCGAERGEHRLALEENFHSSVTHFCERSYFSHFPTKGMV